jgi:hypothetical protein
MNEGRLGIDPSGDDVIGSIVITVAHARSISAP